MKLDETMLTAHDRERIERYKVVKGTKLIQEVRAVRVRLINEVVAKRVN